MIIFVFPLFLLGTVTPSLVKYTVDSLDDNGRIVGNLNAANTVGSIIGTFVPTFVTIPSVGTSVTFLIFSGILLILSAIYFISGKIRSVGMIAAALLFVVCCGLGYSDRFAFWEKGLAYEGESVYNYLQVRENEEHVVLSTNVLFGVQSVYQKKGGLTGLYYDYAMAAPYMTGIHEKEKLNVLILGMGTGTYATQCRRYFPNINFEGVEIDSDITGLARQYFHLPDEVPVSTYDGRAYLNACKTQYDLIMVDAYQDITIPFQMSSTEFFTLVKNHLKEDGVMVVNMNMRGNKEGGINTYLSDTIAGVFSQVYTVDVAGSTNRELFAGNGPDVLRRFDRNLQKEDHLDLAEMMSRIRTQMQPYRAGSHKMTDDQAPVELLGMQVIDDLIGEQVHYYKELYKEKGLKGVLEEL